MNRVTICRGSNLDKVTLKVLPTSCFLNNSEELIQDFLRKLFNKMFRGFREIDRFVKIILSIYLKSL